MNKVEWFANYCNMSEDEKWIYREFEMGHEDKIDINTYRRLYDAVLLMASDYNEQISKLPPKIQVADEIALMFNDEVIAVADDLSKKGMLSEQECYLISSIGNKLKEMSATHNDKLWTLNALQNSADWKDCRSKAGILLLSLEYVDWIIN